MERYYQISPMPKAFIWRRLQSLAGFFLVLFIIEHLLTNSQAALFIGDDGMGFVRAVNGIHDLPYLPLIEILLLGAPFAIHIVWGVKYLFTSKMNAFSADSSKPSLPYARNKAYSIQRLTSWILLIGIIAHVVQMRFVNYPEHVRVGENSYYMVTVNHDEGLNSLAERLGVKLYTPGAVAALANHVREESGSVSPQIEEHSRDFANALESLDPLKGEVVVAASSFGMADLLVVRNVMQSWVMILLYSLFVLSAAYHAFNGLWTFLITWGVILTETSQRLAKKMTVSLMVIVALMGLAAAWGTYWINLKY